MHKACDRRVIKRLSRDTMKHPLGLLLLFVFVREFNLLLAACDKEKKVTFKHNGVNDTSCKCTKNISLRHFWKSTGLSPPDPNDAHNYLLTADEKFNLIFIGSLPHHGIRQVRIHWLLNLITFNETNTSYNFSNLDALLDFMQENNLRPGFELMGLPMNIKPSETKNNIYNYWYILTETIAKHYIERYGYVEVQKWRFETMNEPDLELYNFLNFTLPACTDALHNVSSIHFQTDHTANEYRKLQGIRRVVETVQNTHSLADELNEIMLTDRDGGAFNEANSTDVETRRGGRRNNVLKLRIGGPAGLFKRKEKHPLCWGLLDMCNRSECHLQYVSFHKKGGGSANQVVSEDLAMLDLLKEYRFTTDLAIANDEADILTNWSLDKEWRADLWYAALMSKVIIDHFKEIVLKRNVSIEVLSNDNGFLNYHPYYFTQRTLLARFQMNNTNPPHLQFIKKPVYVAMGLLSMLGDEFLPTDQSKNNDECTYNINILYTKRTSPYANTLTAIIVAVDDNATGNSTTAQQIKTITLDFDLYNLNCKRPIESKKTNQKGPLTLMMTYVLDNDITNPYRIWQHNKSPNFPDKSVRKLMRQNEGPNSKATAKISRHTHRFTISVKIPSIHLINICVNPSLNVMPGKVGNLRGYYVTPNEVLLAWSDKKVQSRCIKTYEVEYRSSQNATFRRINSEDVILLSYQHTESAYTSDWAQVEVVKDSMNYVKRTFVKEFVEYRVRAVDYWDRQGSYSNVVGATNIIHL